MEMYDFIYCDSKIFQRGKPCDEIIICKQNECFAQHFLVEETQENQQHFSDLANYLLELCNQIKIDNLFINSIGIGILLYEELVEKQQNKKYSNIIIFQSEGFKKYSNLSSDLYNKYCRQEEGKNNEK